ncbi:hypothetical protein BVG19_g1097 [[Candida] boidinii]|nr:hypothetical protein BVG19_g1097 [[Candida] boidinii]OWB50115.1 methyltransferase activity protein [[Candida] boidinii]
MTEDTSKLNHSKLGTKEYWDDFYKLEHSNFEKNTEDTGECWFSDSDAEEKIISFLFDNLNELPTIHEQAEICDLGTGNGHLLFQIREEGFKGKFVGIDYSETSVEFAREIADANDVDNIEFSTSDILIENDEFITNNKEKFDIVLDKGTLDAIALSSTKYGENNDLIGADVYPLNVKNLVKKGGILLITSCNFTEEELKKIILKEESLKFWKKVDYPVFEFGGVKGQTICSIAFLKQ